MSFTSENITDIVNKTPEAVCDLLNCMYGLVPAVHALQIICKENNVKPPRRKKGQLNGKKRPLSAYNFFTKMQKDNPELDGLLFPDRARMVGKMWRTSKEQDKYKVMAQDAKDAVNVPENKEEEPAPAVVEDKNPVPEKKEAKKPAAKKPAAKKDDKKPAAKKPAAKKPAAKEDDKKPAANDDDDDSEVDEDDVFLQSDISDSDDE